MPRTWFGEEETEPRAVIRQVDELRLRPAASADATMTAPASSIVASTQVAGPPKSDRPPIGKIGSALGGAAAGCRRAGRECAGRDEAGFRVTGWRCVTREVTRSISVTLAYTAAVRRCTDRLRFAVGAVAPVVGCVVRPERPGLAGECGAATVRVARCHDRPGCPDWWRCPDRPGCPDGPPWPRCWADRLRASAAAGDDRRECAGRPHADRPCPAARAAWPCAAWAAWPCAARAACE